MNKLIGVLILSIALLIGCTTHTNIGDGYELVIDGIEESEEIRRRNFLKTNMVIYSASSQEVEGYHAEFYFSFYDEKDKFCMGDTITFCKK